MFVCLGLGLACHTYCDMRHQRASGRRYMAEILPIRRNQINKSIRGSVTLTPVLPSVWQWSCHYLFLRLRPVAVGNRTSNLLLAPIRRKSLTNQSVIIMTSVFLVNSTRKCFKKHMVKYNNPFDCLLEQYAF